jgi:hypothetical protein
MQDSVFFEERYGKNKEPWERMIAGLDGQGCRASLDGQPKTASPTRFPACACGISEDAQQIT